MQPRNRVGLFCFIYILSFYFRIDRCIANSYIMERNLRCDIPYTTECEHKFVLHVRRIGLICKICIESTNKCLN